MKNVNKIWLYLIIFLLGCLVSYILLQFSFFEIDSKLNVVETIISIGTASIGLYIASTIQKKLNKNQNQSSYVISKLDFIWSEFNKLSQGIIYSDNLELVKLNNFSKEIIHEIGFLKTILNSYDLEVTNVVNLENEIEELENFLLTQPIENNLINICESKSVIEKKIVSINQILSNILKLIHNI
jgi:hypothetical protein